MFVKNNEMKKILLLIAIGVSSLCVNAQTLDASEVIVDINDNLKQSTLPVNEYYIMVYKPNFTKMKLLGLKTINGVGSRYEMPDSLFRYVTTATWNNQGTFSFYWVKVANNDFNTFIFTEKIKYLNGAVYTDGLYTRSFRLDYIQTLGFESELLQSNYQEKRYFDLNGMEINNPDNYEGVMICNSRLIRKTQQR